VATALCGGGVRADGGPPPVDPGAVSLDVNAAAFPDASLIDFSYLLDPPAGRHGFLAVGDDGGFVFEDGTRARFWGINVAKDSVFQPRATIDGAVDAIARAGFNLVRLHHLDDATGLLPSERSDGEGRIDPARLDAVDYWIARLRARGIYVYVDLLSYRTFRAWEGVPEGERLGRGAKPYAVFADRLIELQQDYAAELLVRHVNPYTGLAYADDPCVCLIELCDENGLLRRPAALAELVEPYASELRRRWNAWLRGRYGQSSALRAAWRGAVGKEESIERDAVELRGASRAGPLAPSEAARAADVQRFACETHQAYFRTMRDFLRRQGVRVPITAVGRPGQLADVRAVAAELDFIATNFYWDHPFYPAGREWQLPALYRNENEVASTGVESLVPATAVSRAAGKPLVVREWNACWPNKYRSAAIPAAAAYANLQRYDGMILFGYDTRESAGKLSFFDVRRDPARWGLVGLAARCFLDGDVGPASRSVAILWSDADAFSPDLLPRGRGDSWRLDDIYDMGWVCGLTNVFEGLGRAPEADLVVVPGSAHAGGDTQSATLLFTPANGGASEAAAPDRAQARGADLTAAAAGRGVDLGRLTWTQAVRAALEALEALGADDISGELRTHGTFLSAGGEVRRDERSGVLTIDTPCFQAIGGRLDAGGQLRTSQLSLSSQSSIGTLCAATFDARALGESEHYVIKMVSFAINADERKRGQGRDRGRAIYALEEAGRPPVQTLGRATAQPTTVSVPGRRLLDISMADGTWEVVREGEWFFVFCDTGGMRFFVHELPGRLTLTRYGVDGTVRTQEVRQPVEYPAATRCLRMRGG
jgi:hypothetical protein